jgi:CheY-like chemotaxis protein
MLKVSLVKGQTLLLKSPFKTKEAGEVDMEKTDSNGKSVLVVEDESIIAIVCERTLIAEGFQVDVAINGEIALDMWKEKAYDLCISDIRTPHMNGMELFEQVRDEAPEAANKFIFTTGDVMSAAVKEFLDTTGRLYLAKPFIPDDLRAVVWKALEIV